MQRKVFRVEQFMRPRAPAHASSAMPRRAAPPTLPGHLEQNLSALQDAVAQCRNELASLRGNPGEEPLVARAHKELGATISTMESATQKILKAAEAVDEDARSLKASLKIDYHRGLAQDVQDQVLKIFEASNFQDLAGQRINKAMTTLQTVERQLARIDEILGAVARAAPQRAKAAAPSLLNGPKLAGDNGHAEQHEIDQLFGQGLS